jgi:hypothetical protein
MGDAVLESEMRDRVALRRAGRDSALSVSEISLT